MTIQADPLKGNAVLVDALGSALRRGGNALGSVPDLLKRVLQEESWREFVTQRGEHVRHAKFLDFVSAQPLRGLGADIALIRKVVDGDIEAVDLLDRAVQHKIGTNQPVDNINTQRPDGTSRAYALRRLRADAPELHAEVLAGRLTAHAAMVSAGFTPPRFTVQVTTPDAVAETLRRKLSPEMAAAVAVALTRTPD